MSSLARRTLRTTAAAAGIAALGTGLAGNAVAAPAVDSEAPAPGFASSLQDVPSTLPLAGLPGSPATPGLSSLPTLFVFEAPRVYTAAPASTPPANVDVVANSQQVAGSDTPGSDTDTDTDARTSPTPGQDGALSALDTAGLFGGLTQGGSLVDQGGYDVDASRG